MGNNLKRLAYNRLEIPLIVAPAICEMIGFQGTMIAGFSIPAVFFIALAAVATVVSILYLAVRVALVRRIDYVLGFCLLMTIANLLSVAGLLLLVAAVS